MNVLRHIAAILSVSMACVICPAQSLETADSVVDKAFSLAVNTVRRNTVDSLIRAGGQYGGEWVRDVSINAMNATSVILPDETRYSLWSVTTDGRTRIGHQYWDHIIWVIAAYDHYLKNPDEAFLRQAYTASVNTIRSLENEAFDPSYGLFTGPSVFNDGIAGYEEPIYDPDIQSSYVLDHPNSKNIKTLSTNCIYYQAYVTLADMATHLGDSQAADIYTRKAAALRDNIRHHLYDKQANHLNYLIDHTGTVHHHQEGLGNAFAILFGIVSRDEARNIIPDIILTDYGLPSVTPSFVRFDETPSPGRHNHIIWPFVSAFWASACHEAGYNDLFISELVNLADLAVNKGNNCFYEIYNPYTGKPDGGWQVGHQWDSVYDQTWSATGYLRMIIKDLLGINPMPDGLYINPDPKCMAAIDFKALRDLPLRSTTLSIQRIGNGEEIDHITVNGRPHDPATPISITRKPIAISIITK